MMASARAAAGRAAAFAAVAAISLTAAHAGPCIKQIDEMQVRINARLDALAARGPMAHESIGAMTDRQPTPGSVAKAEEKVGELSAATAASIKQAMARARAADDAGDMAACEKALDVVRHAMGPS